MERMHKLIDLLLGPRGSGVLAERRKERLALLLLATLIFLVFPLTMSAFRLGLVGKYLTYAFVALGLVLSWGYGGILSLGQGVFFGLGGYCMAMFLKLGHRTRSAPPFSPPPASRTSWTGTS